MKLTLIHKKVSKNTIISKLLVYEKGIEICLDVHLYSISPKFIPIGSEWEEPLPLEKLKSKVINIYRQKSGLNIDTWYDYIRNERHCFLVDKVSYYEELIRKIQILNTNNPRKKRTQKYLEAISYFNKCKAICKIDCVQELHNSIVNKARRLRADKAYSSLRASLPVENKDKTALYNKIFKMFYVQ